MSESEVNPSPEVEPEVESSTVMTEGTAPMAPPEAFASELEKTLEESPEWQEMEKSLKSTLEQFSVGQAKEVVDIPLIKRKKNASYIYYRTKRKFIFLAEESIGTDLELPDIPSYYQLGAILQAKLGLVDEEFRCEILNQIQDDVITWIKNIFRFQAKTVNGCRDPRIPILKAIR